MTHSFERITTESNEPFGLPTIRDTGITVSDVVRPIVSGEKSVSDVLDAYPALELEDVHQALAFAVQNMGHAIGWYQHETRQKLTLILGNVGALNYTLANNEEYSWNSINQFLSTISASIPANVIAWDNLGAWSAWNYTSPQPNSLKPETTVALIDKVIGDAQHLFPEFLCDVNYLNEQIKSISVPAILHLVLRNLLLDRDIFAVSLVTTLEIAISQESKLQFVVIRHKDETSENNIIRFETTLSNLHVSALILTQLNSELHTNISNKTITFTFDLPIAENE